jgi:hypothetical protein
VRPGVCGIRVSLTGRKRRLTRAIEGALASAPGANHIAKPMPGSPLKRQRKAGVVDPVTGELVPFPYLTHPRAGLSNAEWRALAPGEKIERLLNMPLDRADEILTWPMAELDPHQLSVKMQVMRIVFMIGMKAMREGKLGRERAPLRAPDPALEKLSLGLRTRLRDGAAHGT